MNILGVAYESPTVATGYGMYIAQVCVCVCVRVYVCTCVRVYMCTCVYCVSACISVLYCMEGCHE